MLRKLMPGLLFLLVLLTFQRTCHAQDCGVNAQSQISQEGQAAGFDNPAESDGVVGVVIFGYMVGFFIVVVRALIRRFFPASAQVTRLKI